MLAPLQVLLLSSAVQILASTGLVVVLDSGSSYMQLGMYTASKIKPGKGKERQDRRRSVTDRPLSPSRADSIKLLMYIYIGIAIENHTGTCVFHFTLPLLLYLLRYCTAAAASAVAMSTRINWRSIGVFISVGNPS